MNRDIKWVMIGVSAIAVFGFGGMAVTEVTASMNETNCKVAAMSSHRTADEIVKICQGKVRN